MHKRIIVALMLVSSIFAVVGCSSGDDQDKGVEVVAPKESTGPTGPQKIYIFYGKDELDSEKLPKYLESDLGESATVEVVTAGNKWKIFVGEEEYEAQYHDFTDDAEAAKVKFDAFTTNFNAGKAAVVVAEYLAKSPILYIDGDRLKKKEAHQRFQELISPIGGGDAGGGGGGGGDGGGAKKKGEQWKTPVALEESYVSGTLYYNLGFEAWLYISSGLGGRSKTWVYMIKADVDSEWKIKEIHTGDEDKAEISWEDRKEYKVL